MTGLVSSEEEVPEFLAGVDGDSSSEADEWIGGEEEAFLLVRLAPEHAQPQVHRTLQTQADI